MLLHPELGVPRDALLIEHLHQLSLGDGWQRAQIPFFILSVLLFTIHLDLRLRTIAFLRLQAAFLRQSVAGQRVALGRISEQDTG